MFSLAVIAYQMLTGKLPYGAEVAKCKSTTAQNKLVYDSIRYQNREIPAWVDDAIRKAVHPNPYKRYEDLTEFIFDLRHPNRAFLNKSRPPLWSATQWLSRVRFLVLLIIIIARYC